MLSVTVIAMDKKVVQNLINARKAIKRKFEELQQDITTGETFLQRNFNPISDPVKELLKNIKKEPESIKSEPTSIVESSNAGQPAFSSTPAPRVSPKKVLHKDTPRPSQKRLPFIKDYPVTESTPEQTLVASSDDDEFSGIDPQAIRQEMEEHPVFKDFISDYGGRAKAYVHDWYLDAKGENDINYGPYRDIKKNIDGEEYDTGKIKLGNSYLDFSKDGEQILITTPDGITFPYKGTVALYELIFKKVPHKASVKKDIASMKDYQEILKKTNAHRLHNNPNNQIKGNVGKKYSEYVKPILAMEFTKEGIAASPFFHPQKLPGGRPRSHTATSRLGKGVMQYSNRKVEYVPYKNPTSLINRLKVLVSSQLAGNNAYDNEIAHIIGELKRVKVIK